MVLSVLRIFCEKSLSLWVFCLFENDWRNQISLSLAKASLDVINSNGLKLFREKTVRSER